MRKLSFLLVLALLLGAAAINASATSTYTLSDYATYKNGTVNECLVLYGCALPSGLTSAADPFGTVAYKFGAGTYTFGVLFNYDNNDNPVGEWGAAFGTQPGGVQFEIDEPGWNCTGAYNDPFPSGRGTGNAVDTSGPCGHVWGDFTNGFPATSTYLNQSQITYGHPFDTSMALMWRNIVVDPGYTKTLYITLSQDAPSDPNLWYLAQGTQGTTTGTFGDPVYMTYGFGPEVPVAPSVPEPGTLALMGAGFACLLGRRWLRR